MPEIDWSALHTPDFAGNALKSAQEGRSDAMVAAKQNALRTYATNPDAGIHDLMAVDPATALQLQKGRREEQAQVARTTAASKLAAGDPNGARQAALGAGDVDLAAAIGKMSAQDRAEAKARADALGNAAFGLKKMPYEQRRPALAAMAPQLAPLGITPEQLAAFDPTDQAIDAQVTQVLGIKGQLEQADREDDNHRADATLTETVRSHRVDEGLHARSVSISAASAAESARHNRTSEAQAELTPQALDYAAEQFRMTGTMPSLGMRSGGARTAIVNRAAQMDQESGATGADAVARHADVHAATGAMANLTRQKAMVQAFESTANKNADVALQLSVKGGAQGQIPVLNRWIQSGRQNVAGDPDVAAFHLALGTLTDEYAKVVTGGGGNVGATDAARHEAERRISAAATPQQLKAVVGTMRREMANRMSSFDDTQGGLHESIRSSASGSHAAGQRLSPQEAAKLPPGTRFVGMDGVERTRH